MTSHVVLLFKLFLAVCVLHYGTGDIIQPCKMNDDECILKSTKEALPQILAGVPSLGVDASDPLHLDLIDGNLSILKYVLTDTTVIGFKDCKIKDVKFSLDKMTVRMDFFCPYFKINGNYVISGRLIILPVEGNGTYTIDAKGYEITMQSELKKSTGKDGKDHLSIKNFKVTTEAKDGAVFEFKNLFNGQKDLSDAVHKFANENWKEVTNFVQEPVFNANFKKIISNVNKYLKTVPFEDLFAN